MSDNEVITQIENRTVCMENHIVSQLAFADKIETRVSAMRKVCRIISIIALIIEILFFIAASYGLVGGLCMRLGISDRYVMWNSMASTSSLNMLIPMNSIIRNRPMMDSRHAVFIFHMIMFFMSVQWGFVVEFVRRIFRNISSGKAPFIKDNIRNLTYCSILVFLSCFVQPVLFLLFLILIALILIFQYGNVLQEKADSTITDQENIIFSLAEITEAKSGQTGQHVKRVSEYSRVLAAGMGLPASKVEEIRLASVLHDIGKLMIDSRILDKPGKLTDEEYAMIKKHVDYGEKLLETVDGSVLSTARVIARDHHERWDGKGYSKGLSQDNISLEGRIVAVADVFDALCSKRSYKEAWTLDDAYAEITKQAGTQFDPEVVEVFVANWGIIRGIVEQYR